MENLGFGIPMAHTTSFSWDVELPVHFLSAEKGVQTHKVRN